MYTTSDMELDDLYYPNGLNMINTNKNFTGGVHTTQHFRANLRISNPPHMFLDDAILAAGIEEYEPNLMDYEPQTPQPSSPRGRTSPIFFLSGECCEEDFVDDDGWEDGMISPLELPPRLLNFRTGDAVSSESLLLGSEPPLDLEELDRRLEALARAEHFDEDQSDPDRRLESIARIERLEKAGLLGAFFAFAHASRA